jgi:peptidoglycan/xylan/chitin deacetylase (PgdA/CDA1 family)
MDREILHSRRAARRQEMRRRRLSFGLILAATVAVALVLLLANGGQSNRPGAGGRGAGSPGKPAASGSGSTATVGAKRTGPRGNEPVPILMYHVIAPPPPGAAFPGLYVAPAEFDAQMRALKGAGWHAVTLEQMQDNWRKGTPLPAGKPIVLTFDNGYQSQFTQALPVLRRLGWVGDENIQLAGLPPSQGGLGRAQVRGLLAAGWELDTQGFSHADLITLDAQRLHYEVAVARSVLQQRYDVPVKWFCYPSGHYDSTVIAAVKAAGYEGSTTVVPGWAHPQDDLYRLHRLRVLGGTTAEQLLAQVASVRDEPPAPPSYNGA